MGPSQQSLLPWEVSGPCLVVWGSFDLWGMKEMLAWTNIHWAPTVSGSVPGSGDCSGESDRSGSCLHGVSTQGMVDRQDTNTSAMKKSIRWHDREGEERKVWGYFRLHGPGGRLWRSGIITEPRELQRRQPGEGLGQNVSGIGLSCAKLLTGELWQV